jgi:Nod factor-specific ABC transporter NodJ protein
MAHPVVAVLERNLYNYRRLWRTSLFSAFIAPILFLVSLGIGVGGYIGRLDGVSYLAWIAPGVVVSTAFQMAFAESTYPVTSDFKWNRAYHAMRASPARTRDLLAGWFIYIVIRVEIAVLAFLVIALCFGAVRSPWAVAVPFVCGLVAVASAAPVTAFAASLDNESYFALLFRLAALPSSLFSGVFFPVSQLPVAMRPLAYALPMWHGVELSRAAMLGRSPAWPIVAHVGVLLAWIVLGGVWAAYAFRRRLEDR